MKTVAVVLGLVASLITIITFVTGTLPTPRVVEPPQNQRDAASITQFVDAVDTLLLGTLNLIALLFKAAVVVALPIGFKVFMEFAMDLLDPPSWLEQTLVSTTYLIVVWLSIAVLFPSTYLGTFFWRAVSHI